MFSDYKETLDYLFSRLPMFHQVGASAYKADLNNIIALLNDLDNPQKNQKWIHIGGTNGKGSTSSMLASIFTANGYKTGLYTSPHLIDFRERIRIDGQCISKEFVISFTNKIQDSIERIHPSFFEITVAMAFEYFKVEGIDIGIIEVGLGGRLDSTNIITPILSAITSIGMDHMDLLGNTLEAIALEKAGIIKSHSTYFLGEMPTSAENVIDNYANTQNAVKQPLIEVPTNWILECELKGKYQASNIQLVFSIFNYLKSKGFKLADDTSLRAISKVNQYSGLRGRWEVISNEPLTICDTGHNEDGIRFIVNQLAEIRKPLQNLFFVWGMVKEKDSSKILKLLPKDARYYVGKPSVIRGQDSTVLCNQMKTENLNTVDCGDIISAFNLVKEIATKEDLIFIGGSTFVVADVLIEISK